MPYMHDGVGTTYYGRRNLLERAGTCEFCGKLTTLQSYDTRYWFVILFIPIIPLGRKRVIDQCGACRRHRVAKLDEWEASRKKAMEEGMRQVVDHPNELAPLMELHRTCLAYGEWERADQLTARIEQEFAQNAQAQMHLAQAHVYRGRPDLAKSAFDRAVELDPSLASKMPAAPAPKNPVKTFRAKVLAGILIVLVVGVFVLVDRSKFYNRTLHVVNGYPTTLQVSIPGLPGIQVSPGGEREITLSEGSYVAHTSGPLSTDLGFEISSHLFARPFDSRTFVLNPGGMAVVVEEETTYAPKGIATFKRPNPFWMHYGKPFEALEHIDYPFQPFPQQITLEKNSMAAQKRRIFVMTQPVPQLVRGLVHLERAPEALALAEWAMDARPSDPDLTAAYSDAGQLPALCRRVEEGLRKRLGRRPLDLPLHRAYQNLALPHRRSELTAEYESYLKADPENSGLIYLRGRLTVGIAAALSYFDRAIAADASNAFALAARAQTHASLGRSKEAETDARKACQLDPRNEAFQTLFRDVRIALGQLDPVESDLQAQCRKEKWEPSAAAFALIDLLASRKKMKEAFELCDKLGRPAPGSDGRSEEILSAQLRCRALYASGDLEGLAREAAKGSRPQLKYFRMIALIERGNLEEADRLAAGDEQDAFSVIERALAWALKGNAAKALALRKAGADLLRKSGNRELETAAELLSAGTPPAAGAAANLDLPPQPKAVLLAVLAQAYPDSASEWIGLARKLNTGLLFPRHLLDRALSAGDSGH